MKIPALTELARLACRDNNTLRPWLLVNPLQGKHIPCSPAKALSLFSALASQLLTAFPSERLLVVGFAETATAIGAALAAADAENASYLPTTREAAGSGTYLYFSESHSHATEQRLVTDKLPQLLAEADRIVFAEDEVTTGNTILKAAAAIKEAYPQRPLKFAVASLLNGMQSHHRETFKSLKIPLFFLHSLENGSYEAQVKSYRYDPDLCEVIREAAHTVPRTAALSGFPNLRTGSSACCMEERVEAFSRTAAEMFSSEELTDKSVLVLGTEEFMYPALRAAAFLERETPAGQVRFHATTRSPILPSSSEGYPIRSRVQLRSVYDPLRTTYLYNLDAWDRVLILHDAPNAQTAAPGLSDLCRALENNGCRHISICQWSE